MNDNHRVFLKLRKKFPEFIYEAFNWSVKDNSLNISYHFILSDEYHFHPQLVIPLKNQTINGIDKHLINSLVFNIGMVELISYWKAACPPVIKVKPYMLDSAQQAWWKKLFYQGLGEFIYLNQIRITQDNLLRFEFAENQSSVPGPFTIDVADGVIIPVGGGKDSLVSLSILSNTDTAKLAIAINPGKATIDSVKVAGLENDFLQIKRTIHPLLLKLNQKGFLNGHTPFSALVAFVSMLTAVVTGFKYVALSNEASANEPTIPGTNINHQYSKSLEFENDFRDYFCRYISCDLQYFSLLRPLNELQIGAVFAKNPPFFTVFRSCNAGSKTNSWCCNCPKCLFTYVMLSCYIEPPVLKEIFGQDLLENQSLIPLLDQLSGFAAEKPFECIGTIDEVNSALSTLTQRYRTDNMPPLLKHYKEQSSSVLFKPLKQQLRYWNHENNLEPVFGKLLRDTLDQL